MNRRISLLSAVAVSRSPSPRPPPRRRRSQSLGKGEGQVDIVAWAGYIERGETDKNYDWVTEFEKKTGCKVNVKTAATSDEMVALMNEGGFDLVTASGDASLRLIAAERCRINIGLIPSCKTVDPRLQNAPWHTVDGKHYGVPYQWGPNVLMYNTEVFKQAADSAGTWCSRRRTCPTASRNKGRVQAYDGPIYIADAALYLMTHKPELGITDPYELNEDQYKAALDLLREQRKLVGRYWHDAFVQMDDFKNEGVVASGSWPFQVNLLKAREAADRQHHPAGRRHRLGRHHHDARRSASIRTAPTCGWSIRSVPSCRATWRPGSARYPAVPAACKGNALLTARRLQDQRLRRLRQDRVLEDPSRRSAPAARRLRALLPLGDGLHRA